MDNDNVGHVTIIVLVYKKIIFGLMLSTSEEFELHSHGDYPSFLDFKERSIPLSLVTTHSAKNE
ncbi:unnamed protein product [Sphenostylis stenocarpa]|uniref:Uncharacterized protein n=1 Tax=Sphenostylis stenocarpa TaxID=92480 RepID=A0AA86SV96_9FABA|nr:unnamed protein product [Sphenostylis stenocarpa]